MVFLVIPSIPSLDGANSPNHVTYHPILYIINFLFFIFSHHFKSHMLPISPGGLSSNIIDSISFFLIKKKIITNVFFPLLELRIPSPIKKMVWDGMTFYAISLVCWCLIWPLEGLWRLPCEFHKDLCYAIPCHPWWCYENSKYPIIIKDGMGWYDLKSISCFKQSFLEWSLSLCLYLSASVLHSDLLEAVWQPSYLSNLPLLRE